MTTATAILYLLVVGAVIALAAVPLHRGRKD